MDDDREVKNIFRGTWRAHWGGGGGGSVGNRPGEVALGQRRWLGTRDEDKLKNDNLGRGEEEMLERRKGNSS